MTIEELQVVIDAQTAGLTKQLGDIKKQLGAVQNETNKVTSSMTTAFKKLIGAVVALKIGQKIGQAIVGGIKDAMKVESSIQQIQRLMGESTNAFLKWANTQALAFNMSKTQAMSYGATYANLVTSFSKSNQDTMQYTEDLLKASSIVASATGRTMDDVMERIRSGILGNTEAIEDLGIYAQVGAIQATDAFKKLANGKTWDQLDYQTQQQIRVMSILEQTTKKYGDAVLDNTASRLQQLIAVLNNVKLNIGQAFMPVVNIVLPILTAFASKLEYVTSVIAQLSQALFGKSVKTSTAAAASTNNQASAVSNLGNAYDTAGKQAKKAKSFLAGFDEINNITNSASDSGSGAGTAGASGVNTDSGVSDEAGGISNGILKMAQNIKSLFEPVQTAFENLKKATEPLINTVGTALKAFYDNVLVPFGQWVISDAIPAFLNLLAAALRVINPLLQAINPLIGWLWENILKPIATWTGAVFIAALNGITSALNAIGQWMSNNQSTVQDITLAVVAFIGAWKLIELLAFIQMSGGLIAAITSIGAALKAATIAKIADKLETIALTVLYAKDFVVSLAKSSAALVSNAVQWATSTAALIANKIAMIASTVAQAAMTAATLAWNAAATIGAVVTTAFGTAVAFLTSPIGIAVAAIVGLIAIIVLLVKNWSTVSQVASTVWEGVKSVWSSVSSWFSINVCTPIASLFKGMANGLIGVFNNIIAGVEKLINGCIDGINKAIYALDVFKSAAGIAGWIYPISHISAPRIPTFAGGGFPNMGSLFIANEAGPEMVGNVGARTAVVNNNQIVEAVSQGVAQAVAATLGSNKSTDRPLELILQVGSTELGRVVIDSINKLTKQQGKLALNI